MAQAKWYDSSSTSLESVGIHPARVYLGGFEAAPGHLLGPISETLPGPRDLRHPHQRPAPADSAGENSWRWRKKTLIFCKSYSVVCLFVWVPGSIAYRYKASALQAKRSHQLCWSTGSQYLAEGQARLLASLRKSRLQANAWTCCFGCNWKSMCAPMRFFLRPCEVAHYNHHAGLDIVFHGLRMSIFIWCWPFLPWAWTPHNWCNFFRNSAGCLRNCVAFCRLQRWKRLTSIVRKLWTMGCGW